MSTIKTNIKTIAIMLLMQAPIVAMITPPDQPDRVDWVRIAKKFKEMCLQNNDQKQNPVKIGALIKKLKKSIETDRTDVIKNVLNKISKRSPNEIENAMPSLKACITMAIKNKKLDPALLCMRHKELIGLFDRDLLLNILDLYFQNQIEYASIDITPFVVALKNVAPEMCETYSLTTNKKTANLSDFPFISCTIKSGYYTPETALRVAQNIHNPKQMELHITAAAINHRGDLVKILLENTEMALNSTFLGVCVKDAINRRDHVTAQALVSYLETGLKSKRQKLS